MMFKKTLMQQKLENVCLYFGFLADAWEKEVSPKCIRQKDLSCYKALLDQVIA